MPGKNEQGKSELTPLQKVERAAMCGNKAAVLQCVNALRSYRALVREILGVTSLGKGIATMLFDMEHKAADIEEMVS